MAAIGQIRKQSGLLIALIGMAMLLFLLSDLFSNGTSFFTQEEQTVGTIAGSDISLQEFEIRVQNTIDEQFGVEGANEQARERIRERVWQEMVRERVLNTELEKLGIGVSEEELLDQVKNVQPNSVLYQYFTDPNTGQIIEQFRDPQTGGMNSQRVLAAIQNLLNSENAKDWLPIERAIEQDVIINKYTNLLTKGLMANSVQAQQIGKEKNTTLSFKYVLKEYTSIPDEEATPSDEELKAYYNAHKNETRFEIEQESRSLNVAYISIQPTPEDISAISQELEAIKPSFAADSNDTAFVGENADSRIQQLIGYYTESDLPTALKDTVPNAALGSVFGPFAMNDRMNVAKLTAIKMEPDSVKASHILINIQDGDTAKIAAAKDKLDSLKQVAESKNNFATLAEEYSEDFGSAAKGGDLDWFTRGRMVAPFEKACFEGKVGDMVIVESQFGVHLINITDQSKEKPKYLIAMVDRLIEPSKATTDAAYKTASNYALSHSNANELEADQEKGIMVDRLERVPLGERVLGPIQNAKEIIRWAYDAEEGTVSNPIETENFFVIAGLVSVNEEGIMSFDQAKQMIYTEVMNEKKADKIREMLGGATGISDVANALGSEIRSADNVNFAQGALPGGLGREMKVMGTAFAMESGSVSGPIEGDRGVYVIMLTNKKPAGEIDITSIKREESSNMSSRINAGVLQALQGAAGVEDRRAKYY
jgi:peptidyl-prolyl cis-trans isomerase D